MILLLCQLVRTNFNQVIIDYCSFFFVRPEPQKYVSPYIVPASSIKFIAEPIFPTKANENPKIALVKGYTHSLLFSKYITNEYFLLLVGLCKSRDKTPKVKKKCKMKK